MSNSPDPLSTLADTYPHLASNEWFATTLAAEINTARVHLNEPLIDLQEIHDRARELYALRQIAHLFGIADGVNDRARALRISAPELTSVSPSLVSSGHQDEQVAS